MESIPMQGHGHGDSQIRIVAEDAFAEMAGDGDRPVSFLETVHGLVFWK